MVILAILGIVLYSLWWIVFSSGQLEPKLASVFQTDIAVEESYDHPQYEDSVGLNTIAIPTIENCFGPNDAISLVGQLHKKGQYYFLESTESKCIDHIFMAQGNTEAVRSYDTLFELLLSDKSISHLLDTNPTSEKIRITGNIISGTGVRWYRENTSGTTNLLISVKMVEI